MKPDLSLVIPVFNEEKHLPQLIERCLQTCRALERSFEIVLVDDGSKDASRQLISAAAHRFREVRGVLLNRNYGQHAAVLAGFAESRGEIVVTLDADLQNPPEEIPLLLDAMGDDVDVVGSRRLDRQDSLFRRLFSRLVNHWVKQATGVAMSDYGCMLRAYRRPIIKAMLRCEERSTFIPILANSFASKTAEVAVKHAPRHGDASKYSLFKLVSLQFDLLTSMSTFPLRLLTFLGLALSCAGIGFGLLLLSLRLALGAPWAGDGVFTLFAVLFVLIGAQFIGMGLLGEYIGRIYHDVRARPRYFVREVVGRPPEAVATNHNFPSKQRPRPAALVNE